jgi:hypothetical protein
LAASDKVYQLLARGRWFSPGTPASSTAKTGCHNRSNRYLNNIFLKTYYKFFIAKIRLIMKRILNPNNVFITQNLPDITKKIAEQTNRLPVFRYEAFKNTLFE